MSDSVPVYDDKKNVIGEATVDGDRVEVELNDSPEAKKIKDRILTGRTSIVPAGPDQELTAKDNDGEAE